MCAPRLLCSQSAVEPPLHAGRRHPVCCGPHPRPAPYALRSTRQQAWAFNQPLSFDTSSVTSMREMFYVRSAHAL